MIRVAIIGCGYWGPNILRNLDALPECEVKMICDTSVSRLEKFQLTYPHVKTTQHSNEIFSNPNIDAVAICTPVHSHYQLAKESLLRGKHTFIEKPMAQSVAQCEELVKLANLKKCTLMVGHTFLYSPVVRKIKEIVDSGELGTIQYISSRRLNLGLFQKDINCAWDLAPHDISIILYLAKELPISVNCQGKAHKTLGVEDVTNISLDFSDGCFATIHSSWLDPNKVREMTIVGERKMLVYDDTEIHEKLKIYDKRVETPPYYDTYGEFPFSYHYGDIYSPRIPQQEPLKVECAHFLECIQTRQTPLTDGENGMEVVRILESASKSLVENGARITLPERYQTLNHSNY